MVIQKFLNELQMQHFHDFFSLRGMTDEHFEASQDGLRFTFASDSLEVVSDTTAHEDGVCTRRDSVTNRLEETVCLFAAKSKFVLPDGEYEVYTQFNNWQNESLGGWQPLVTGVSSKVSSVRTAVGAAPVLALWNRQNSRGIVFHLPAVFSWEMSVRRVDVGSGKSRVEVTIGPDADSFRLTLASGETRTLSDIIYFSFKNKTDLDCYKLHRYMNRIAPRRTIPVIYNTWLANFDSFTYESLSEQAAIAAKIGAEYFVVDAGWFAEPMKWWGSTGDWKECLTSGFAGRMREFSDYIHGLGMKFGVWFEIERAGGESESVKCHPDYYIAAHGQYFVDYTKPEAREYILNLLHDRIGRYRIDFIKFDFNADLFDDPEETAFMRYYEGYETFIRSLRGAHPDLYLENCASGGMRMQLANGLLCDSFWLSDNQSAFDSMRIFKDTMLRMPPQWIEKWATILSYTDCKAPYGGHNTERLLTVDDGTWENVASVSGHWMKGFLSGGPLGISSDLTRLSESVIALLTEQVAEFKRDRAFFLEADCRLLADTDEITAFEYANRDLSVIKVLTFIRNPIQTALVLYPAVDERREYRIDGNRVSGEELAALGIRMDFRERNHCIRIDIDNA